MSCPTCDHTMNYFGETPGEKTIYWCPRCGTLRYDQEAPVVHRPKLVERCREFGPTIYPRSVHAWNDWVRLGIAESINLPGDRPQ